MSSSTKKWALVLFAAAMHPVLLYVLFPLFGERSNLVIVIAPLLATVLFRWWIGAIFTIVNAIGTAVMFSLIAGNGAEEGRSKALVAVLITVAICFVVDLVKRFIQKGRDMQAELDQLRNPRR